MQSGMNHHQWILVPWVVFAVALAFKIWQFRNALKRHLIGTTPSTDQLRQTLERIWAQAKEEGKWRT